MAISSGFLVRRSPQPRFAVLDLAHAQVLSLDWTALTSRNFSGPLPVLLSPVCCLRRHRLGWYCSGTEQSLDGTGRADVQLADRRPEQKMAVEPTFPQADRACQMDVMAGPIELPLAKDSDVPLETRERGGPWPRDWDKAR